MVAVGDRLYAISGEAGPNVPTNEVYLPDEDRWYLSPHPYAARPSFRRCMGWSSLCYWWTGFEHINESHPYRGRQHEPGAYARWRRRPDAHRT